MTTELMTLPEFKFSSFEPAVIEFNFAEMSSALDAHLEKYSNVKVTAESLADDKKLSQELNKQIKTIARARIDRKNELTEPVSAFEAQMKELEQKIEAVRSVIAEQVKVFEQEKLAEIYEIIATEFESQVEQAGLRAEFANFGEETQSLTKLTAVTAKDALTAKTKSEILASVNDRLNTQNMVDLRLAKLEAECYRLGLAAPLTKAHVSSILLLDEDTYQVELEKIIAAEVQREQQAVEAHKAKLEAEAKAQAQAEVEQEQYALVDEQAPYTPAPQQQATTNGKTIVTCTFELDVPAHAPSEAIEAKFRKLLEEAGFTTLANIHIQRPQNEEAA